MTTQSMGSGSDFEETCCEIFVLIFYGALFDESGAAATEDSIVFACKRAANIVMMYTGHACSSFKVSSFGCSGNLQVHIISGFLYITLDLLKSIVIFCRNNRVAADPKR